MHARIRKNIPFSIPTGPTWPLLPNEGGDGNEGGAGGGGTGGDGGDGGGDGGGGDGFAPITSQQEFEARLKDRLSRQERQIKSQFPDYDVLKEKAAKYDAAEAEGASDQDKAIKAAVDEATAKVTAEFGQKFARAVFKAQLGARIDDADTVNDLLDDINLAKFIGEDGEVDEDAITKAVNRLAPASTGGPDLGQGPKGGNPGEKSAADVVEQALKR